MKRKISIISVLTLLFAVLVFAQCGKKGSITISSEWVSETIPGSRVSAGYMNILNSTGKDDVLVKVEAENFENVEFHNMTEKDGVMSMEALDSIAVKDGEKISFAPGGMHIMLINNNKPLKSGDFETLTLYFEKAGTVTRKIPVKNIQEQVN